MQALESCANENAFQIGLGRALAAFGFEYFVLTRVPHIHERFEEVGAVSGWPDGWYEMYCKGKFALRDPILAHCRSSTALIDWDTVPAASDAKGPDIMRYARDYGMRTGLSLPIHGPSNEVACFSISGRSPDITARTRPILHLIAMYAGERARSLHVLSSGRSNPLTGREQEVLKWAAVGKSAAVTPEILSVTRRTVTAHTVNAMDKLGAANKTQAVVHAMQCGFIDL